MFRLLLLFVGWMMFSGFTSPHCSATDTAFGEPPEVLNPEEWDGYWCSDTLTSMAGMNNPCDCFYVRASEEDPGELWIEFFSGDPVNAFYVAEV